MSVHRLPLLIEILQTLVCFFSPVPQALEQVGHSEEQLDQDDHSTPVQSQSTSQLAVSLEKGNHGNSSRPRRMEGVLNQIQKLISNICPIEMLVESGKISPRKEFSEFLLLCGASTGCSTTDVRIAAPSLLFSSCVPVACAPF